MSRRRNLADTNGCDPAFVELRRALHFARRALHPDVTAQRLLILLCVYDNEGLSQRELLGKLEDTSITALSRNLADLSALNTRKDPGPGLVTLRTSPQNLRIKRVYLTAAGKRFVTRWRAAMAGAAGAVAGRKRR